MYSAIPQNTMSMLVRVFERLDDDNDGLITPEQVPSHYTASSNTLNFNPTQMFDGINRVCRQPIGAKAFNFLMLQLEFVAHTAKVARPGAPTTADVARQDTVHTLVLPKGSFSSAHESLKIRLNFKAMSIKPFVVAVRGVADRGSRVMQCCRRRWPADCAASTSTSKTPSTA